MEQNEDKPIKIAHVIGKWVGGGVEAVVMNYYRNIDHSKIQFDFICDDDSIDIPYEEIESLGGKIILIPPYQKVLKYQKQLKEVLKAGNYKIVHSHINTLSVFPLYAAKKAGVPVRIAHSHSTTNKKEWKKNLLKLALRPFAKLYATNYFACTEHAGRWLFGDKEFEKGNVYILNNAIDIDKFKYNEEVRKQKRKELGIDDDTLVIGHIGRFVEQKNHRFLIDVFNEVHKKNKNSKLILVGQGPLEWKIRNKVKNMNLEENVIFLGQRRDVNELYHAFDMLILPSLYEGLGIVLIEAEISGVHCVCSEEVPRIVDITKKVQFISLGKTAENWSEKILNNYEIKNRKYILQDIDISDYDITKEAKKLVKEYMKFSKIKVCHVVCGLKSGGVESMIKNYCSILDEEQYEWHLLYQHDPVLKNLKEFEKLGFKLKRIAAKAKNPLRNYIDTYNYLKKNSIDIVHCHMTIMNFIPLYVAKRCGIKVRICHSHNSDVRDKNIIIKVVEKLFKYLSMKYATVLIACGNDAGKYMYGKNEYIVLRNAMDFEKFKFNEGKRKKIRQDLNISDDTIVIGNVGRFTNQKNQIFLIELISKLLMYNGKYKLLLIGEGEELSIIKKAVDNYGVQENVIFTGIVNNINEYYSAFDIFTLPSLWEGLPLVAIEAQMSGIKCILSKNIDANAIIIKENCQMLNINIDEWQKEILSYSVTLQNRIKSKEKFIKNGYDINNESYKLANIYMKNRKCVL